MNIFLKTMHIKLKTWNFQTRNQLSLSSIKLFPYASVAIRTFLSMSASVTSAEGSLNFDSYLFSANVNQYNIMKKSKKKLFWNKQGHKMLWPRLQFSIVFLLQLYRIISCSFLLISYSFFSKFVKFSFMLSGLIFFF